MRVPRIKENRVPRIREIGSLQAHTGYLTFSLNKTVYNVVFFKYNLQTPAIRWVLTEQCGSPCKKPSETYLLVKHARTSSASLKKTKISPGSSASILMNQIFWPTLTTENPGYDWNQWRNQPKIGGGKCFNFKSPTVFCLEHRLSRHKMTRFARNLGAMSLGPPGYAYDWNLS